MPTRPLLFLLLLALGARAETTIRIDGSAALVVPLASAAKVLQPGGVHLEIDSSSNTPRAIAAVGEGKSDFAIATRPVLAEEQAAFPERSFVETVIGYQALSFIVSNDVWEGGTRALSKAEMQKIYEGKVTNWKQLGGIDRKIKYFDPQKGKGLWEFLAAWLYVEAQNAPSGDAFETVATHEETRNVVEFNGGALSLIAAGRPEERGVHVLALRLENGKTVPPTVKNIRSGAYPLRRPIIIVAGGRPSGAQRRVLDFMVSAQGQALVRGADMIPLQEEETE